MEYYETMSEAILSSCIFNAILMTFVLKVMPAGEIISVLISFNSSTVEIPYFSFAVLLVFDFRSPDFMGELFFLRVWSIFSIIVS